MDLFIDRANKLAFFSLFIYCMEHISKKVDSKLSTLAKLQLNYRQRQLDFAEFEFGNQVDLPQKANLLVRFPSVRKGKAEIKNSRKRKSILQMDHILDKNTHKINTDDIDRIIFASPIKSRLTYHRTFFRSSLYYTVENTRGKMKNGLHAFESMEEKVKRQAKEFSLMPIKGQKQNQKNEQIKINWLSPQPNHTTIKQALRFSNMFDSNPETILERRKQERKSLQIKPAKNKNRPLDRYSPWKNDDLEEELIL